MTSKRIGAIGLGLLCALVIAGTSLRSRSSTRPRPTPTMPEPPPAQANDSVTARETQQARALVVAPSPLLPAPGRGDAPAEPQPEASTLEPESVAHALSRLDDTRRVDEAVFSMLDLSDKVRFSIRVINAKERHAWFPSGKTEDQVDPAAARAAALEQLLGPDGNNDFKAAESVALARLTADRAAPQLKSDDAAP
jgi:hypothetical protein